MIPFGHWHPDAAALNAPLVTVAKNCLPSPQGFRPLKAPAASGGGLPGRCLGAVTVLKRDGSVVSFAGTASGLYRAEGDGSWTDVSRVDDPYVTPAGERWHFAVFGDNLIATNFNDVVQVLDMSEPTAKFGALGGSPPKARYIAIVREFVLLGCLEDNETAVQWCSIGNSAEWTPGLNSGDLQVFPANGPVRGLVGGEVGYVFQAQAVSRMIFAPGSDEVFQFDEVEGVRGLAGPSSLVRLAREAFYFAGDGFYRFDLVSGASQPIGVGKWARWFQSDLRAGTELEVLSAVSPQERGVLFPYISRGNSGTVPDRVLIYDWSIDEATFAEITIEAAAAWLTQGYTLDTMNAFGTLDELPYSLDAPFWKGGAPQLAVFDGQHRIGYLQGAVMRAEFETADGQGEQRVLIKATRPHIDTADVTVSVAMRERDSDPVTFPSHERMEDTGEVPAWASGNIARAHIVIGRGSEWTYAKGIKTLLGRAGRR